LKKSEEELVKARVRVDDILHEFDVLYTLKRAQSVNKKLRDYARVRVKNFLFLSLSLSLSFRIIFHRFW